MTEFKYDGKYYEWTKKGSRVFTGYLECTCELCKCFVKKLVEEKYLEIKPEPK
jgi:hypothetical protein